MSKIERRLEAPGHENPDYQGFEVTDDRRERKIHRMFVGGKWDQLGKMQLEFLKGQGLTPQDRLLDVGCGAFRAGRHLVDYLEPAHYYGIDINHSLIETGYEHELTEAQRERLPPENLHSTDRFDGEFGVQFDLAIAQSVFTHIPLNMMRLCLYRIGKVVKPGGKFYVTFLERGPEFPLDGIAKGRLYTERNAFWYYRNDLRWVARRTPWSFRYIGDWNHPRDQRMVEYTRLED